MTPIVLTLCAAILVAGLAFAPKGWRTVIANGLVGAIIVVTPVLEFLTGFDWRSVLPPEWAPMAILVVNVLNIGLRAVTSTPIFARERKEGPVVSAVIAWLLQWLAGGALDRVLAHLERTADRGGERARIEAEVAIEHVRAELGRRQAQRDLLLAEQGRWWSALPRPLFAVPLGLWWSAVIADSLFHFSWDVAALPAPLDDWAGLIVAALFLAEGGERIGRTIAAARRGGTPQHPA